MAREWATERVQWGQPVGKHEAVAKKLAFMAGTAFAIEAVSDLSSLMADEDRYDIRIEAALAKLFCSEMTCRIADELVQVRGGRGFETAASLRARGERAVGAEQVLRDVRINRIFEGSSEIMRLLIAREAVDQHLAVAGDLIDKDADAKTKRKAAARATGFYGRWVPGWPSVRAKIPAPTASSGGWPDTCGTWSGPPASWPATSSTACPAGKAPWSTSRSSWAGQSTSRPICGPSAPWSCAARMLGTEEAQELAQLFCRQARRRVDQTFHDLWHNDDADEYQAALRVLDGRYTFLEDHILDPSGTDPLIASWEQPTDG